MENLGHLHCRAFSIQLWKLRHCPALSFPSSPHPCSIVSACFPVSQRHDITVRSVWHRDLLVANVVRGDSQKRRKECLAGFHRKTKPQDSFGDKCLGEGGDGGSYTKGGAEKTRDNQRLTGQWAGPHRLGGDAGREGCWCVQG